MGVWELLGSKKIRPEWRYQADGVIWQLYTGNRDLLIGEDRTIESRRVTFFCLDRGTGSVLWRGLALPEQWWVGIETICSGVVLFHMYASPDLPGHRGLVGVDMRSGSILWTLPRARFLECTGGGMRVSTSAEGREEITLLVDVRTGLPMSPVLEGQNAPQSGSDSEAGAGPIELPGVVNADTPEFRSLKTVLRGSLAPETLRMPVQVLKAGALLVLLTHRPHRGEGPGVHARIHLLRQADGRIVFEDTLLARTRAESGQHVFAQDGRLYYIQERRTLVAIALGETRHRTVP